MNYARSIASEKTVFPADTSSPAPWLRAARDLSAMDETEAAFLAGAALQALDGLIRDDPDWSGVWRSRMALKAASTSSQLLGRPEEEAALRDAVCLTRPGSDPGPAGRTVLAWRRLARHTGMPDSALLNSAAEFFGLKSEQDFAEIAGHIGALMRAGKPGPFAAIETAEYIAMAHPTLSVSVELLGFWVADLVLAARLKWPRPVPLLVIQAQKPFFRSGPNRRRLRIGEAGWRRAVLIAYVQAALEAHDTAADIARRAERLKAIVPKLRAKGSARIVEALLQEDALLPSACVEAFPGQAMTDRALRRLFERLVSLEAVRELTGRATFRLYGL
ncbi:hypothetical protein ATN84_10730 [Paramesorhizobium deserti]|uniref:DUF1403 family protein n=1 Tax=Paramesorhizobium deserti TaxID=1494590 RepID=A0A135HTK6_9HYPH|nr:DUF1403 family protein [Paramesorhizobium deserti]KXF76535.1 hypothetical protein ATN84_10730 [Paramesorhizobium deserti]